MNPANICSQLSGLFHVRILPLLIQEGSDAPFLQLNQVYLALS